MAPLYLSREEVPAQDLDSQAEQMRSEALGRYLPTSVKLMLDGVVENNTASMIEPYHDRDGGLSDNTGIDFIEDELAKRRIDVQA
mgnify:CR=1 FL=1